VLEYQKITRGGMYKTLKKLLFLLPPEVAHRLSLFLLKKAPAKLFFTKKHLNPITALGLNFPNPIGLAAGFDKNGDHLESLAKLGFGFIEVGTVTPLPQEGNHKPRIFRFPFQKALINRMGFNNKGVDYLVERLKQHQYKGIIGVNIGKNAQTTIDEAVEDYLICLKKVYPYADYITLNISSPNTPNLRQLQQNSHLNCLLLAVSTMRSLLASEAGKYKPLLLKISPDETIETQEAIVNAVIKHQIDGIIATNTTTEKSCMQHLSHGNETGGLSGAPLFDASTATLNNLYSYIQEKKANTVLIGVGGIMKPADMQAKFSAGAQLVQVYTGLIYKGPLLIKRLINALSES
jgi:dihydroorotate dehydrogenase